MKISPPGMNITARGEAGSRTWLAWASNLSSLVTGLASSGTTADRPTVGLYTGRPYFDTTLGQPIWYDGTQWVDATGTAA